MKPIITAITSVLSVFLVFCLIREGWDMSTWPDDQQAMCVVSMIMACLLSAMFASEKS